MGAGLCLRVLLHGWGKLNFIKYKIGVAALYAGKYGFGLVYVIFGHLQLNAAHSHSIKRLRPHNVLIPQKTKNAFCLQAALQDVSLRQFVAGGNGNQAFCHGVWYKEALLFGRKVKGNSLVLEVAFMRTIAERFVLGLAAAADRNQGAATQAVRVSVLIHNFKVAFYAQRSVVVNCYFRCCHYMQV